MSSQRLHLLSSPVLWFEESMRSNILGPKHENEAPRSCWGGLQNSCPTLCHAKAKRPSGEWVDLKGQNFAIKKHRIQILEKVDISVHKKILLNVNHRLCVSSSVLIFLTWKLAHLSHWNAIKDFFHFLLKLFCFMRTHEQNHSNNITLYYNSCKQNIHEKGPSNFIFENNLTLSVIPTACR